MKFSRALILSLIALSTAPAAWADVEDGGFYDSGSGEFYGGGDGGGLDYGGGGVVADIVGFGVSEYEMMELSSQIGYAAQRVEVIGARIIDSNYFSAIDMSEYDRMALYEANQLAATLVGAVQTSPTSSANSPSAKKAAAAIKSGADKAKADRAKVNSIDKDPNRCSQTNRTALSVIEMTNVDGAENTSCTQTNGVYWPNTDICIARLETSSVGSQYGYNDSTYLNLRSGVDALRADMVSIASWARGIIESCDL